MDLACELTDYSRGSPLPDVGPEPFEQLDSPDTAAARSELPTIIGRAMAAAGVVLERRVALVSTEVARVLAELPEAAAGIGIWKSGLYAATIDSAPCSWSNPRFVVWSSQDYEAAVDC